MATQDLKLFVDWEEKYVSHDRGSRVVHYYLKDRHGQYSLAVVGTERSLRHMVYVVCDDFLPLAGLDKSATSAFKWRARREVVDWLQTLVTKIRSGSSEQYHSSGSPSTEPAASSEVDTLMEENGEATEYWTQTGPREYVEYVRHQINPRRGDVTWIGGPWTCRKGLEHYHSFQRAGTTISVHDFVYVLTEHDRHIAYVEDMYYDKKWKKKIRVRWFHKTSELTCKIPPPAPHTREVFYTSFPQVLSVECVDGVAIVLSPDHFDACFKSLPAEAVKHLHVCSRQFDSNEGLKSFNIQEVKGYLRQKVLLDIGLKIPPEGDWSPPHTEPGSEDVDIDEDEAEPGNVVRRGPRTARTTRRRVGVSLRMQGGDSGNHSTWVSSPAERACSTSDGAVTGGETALATSISDARLPSNKREGKWEEAKNVAQVLEFKAGTEVEILSQDSGLRGCWFKATITRRVSKRLKVMYDKLQNEDGEGNLEEWVSAWRLAGPDKLGMRVVGRTTVRPFPCINVSPGDCSIGQAVDAWWNDGRWEGIIINKESGGDVQVYFPGEGDTEVFKVEDLRISRDWVYGSWIDIPCNPDAAAKAANPAKMDKSKTTNEIQMVSVKQQPSPNEIPSKVS